MTREQVETDILIVGAGPAGLACAIRLAQHIAADEAAGRKPVLSPDGIFILEKGNELGAHSISGSIMDSRALAELIPDYRERGAPIECEVIQDELFFLNERRSIRLPMVPSFLENRGNSIISLGRLVQWMGREAESVGINIFTSTAGAELIVENNQVCGVVTDEKGLNRNGIPGENHEAGIELRARITLLAEGARGSLSRRLINRFGLDTDSNPPSYGLGVKEIWEVPEGRVSHGTVWHTFGHPLPSDMQGGGWLYAMPGNRVSLGLVVGLHYANPEFDIHRSLQMFKQHPLIREVLGGGKMTKYGARVINKGGYWSLPKLHVSGALLVGDAAGFLDSLRLKGVHMAIKSGMLAADTAYEALRQDDITDATLSSYRKRFENSWMRTDLWRARNHEQGFKRGLFSGIAHTVLQSMNGGRGTHSRYLVKDVGSPMDPKHRAPMPEVGFDGILTFDKPASVFHSGTRHREDQPVHLVVQDPDKCERCGEKYGNPCQHFCPAGVYEMVDGDHSKRLHINAANCLHCKACDILDPYCNMVWSPPEGGGGPRYEGM